MSGRVASVYFCEKGCRVESIWSIPQICRVKLNRREICDLPLFRIGELPEQVERKLNPLKASKRGGSGSP